MACLVCVYFHAWWFSGKRRSATVQTKDETVNANRHESDDMLHEKASCLEHNTLIITTRYNVVFDMRKHLDTMVVRIAMGAGPGVRSTWAVTNIYNQVYFRTTTMADGPEPYCNLFLKLPS